MPKVLTSHWFDRDAETVARELLGKSLCRRLPGGDIAKSIITETEAYVGPDDAASHAYRNKRTSRTEVMFSTSGSIYIYLIYGLHNMLNIVTDAKGFPSAVLIRGVGMYDGPGKLTKGLQIDRSLNNRKLSKDAGLWVEAAPLIADERVAITPRVGINYAAEPWLSAPLRFMIV